MSHARLDSWNVSSKPARDRWFMALGSLAPRLENSTANPAHYIVQMGRIHAGDHCRANKKKYIYKNETHTQTHVIVDILLPYNFSPFGGSALFLQSLEGARNRQRAHSSKSWSSSPLELWRFYETLFFMPSRFFCSFVFDSELGNLCSAPLS